MPEAASWAEHQRLVMDALERGQVERMKIIEDVILIRIEVAKLKVVASLAGAIAGMLAGVVISLVQKAL